MNTQKLQVIQLGSASYAVADEDSMSLLTVTEEVDGDGKPHYFAGFYSRQDAQLFCIAREMAVHIVAMSGVYKDKRMNEMAVKILEAYQ